MANFVERAPQMTNFVERPQQLPSFMERPQQRPTFERPQAQESEEAAPQPEIRIHLRRIAIPGSIGDIFPFLNNAVQSEVQKEDNEAPRQNVQIQQMPLAVALSKVGITPDDLRNIQRMAEEKFQQHIREMVADEDDSTSESESAQSEEDTDSGMPTQTPDLDSTEEQKNQSSQELHEASSQQEQRDNQRPQILALGRSNFGRSLNPIQLPDHMTENAEIQEAERADCEF